jgi:hypothetical protein
MSGRHDTFVDALNEHLRQLVDDGCFDLANKFYDLLEEYDLLKDEDLDEYEEEDADSEDVRD